ncbi:MAG: TetR/AcrR family transcriptional regulator [Bacteriovoracaceae bacterium]|nr:TetR/AcrR family transcriptional regulator [Bacteriovoracaceae bacterium]
MPKIINIELQKNEILRASVSLFARQGYIGLSMRSLALKLGMTTGTLYHYFKNKEDLYSQMLFVMAMNDSKELLKKIESHYNAQKKLEIFSEFLESKTSYFQNAVLILLDANRFKQDDKYLFTPLLKNAIDLYERSILEIFELKNQSDASTILNLLIGIFTRSLIDNERLLNFKEELKDVIITKENRHEFI